MLDTTGLDLRSTVALCVMGWSHVYIERPTEERPGRIFGYKGTPTGAPMLEVPSYELILGDAMSVAEAMKETHKYGVDISWQGDGWSVKMGNETQSLGLACSRLFDLPQTICRVAAFLRWHQLLAEAKAQNT